MTAASTCKQEDRNLPQQLDATESTATRDTTQFDLAGTAACDGYKCVNQSRQVAKKVGVRIAGKGRSMQLPESSMLSDAGCSSSQDNTSRPSASRSAELNSGRFSEPELNETSNLAPNTGQHYPVSPHYSGRARGHGKIQPHKCNVCNVRVYTAVRANAPVG